MRAGTIRTWRGAGPIGIEGSDIAIAGRTVWCIILIGGEVMVPRRRSNHIDHAAGGRRAASPGVIDRSARLYYMIHHRMEVKERHMRVVNSSSYR